MARSGFEGAQAGTRDLAIFFDQLRRENIARRQQVIDRTTALFESRRAEKKQKSAQSKAEKKQRLGIGLALGGAGIGAFAGPAIGAAFAGQPLSQAGGFAAQFGGASLGAQIGAGFAGQPINVGGAIGQFGQQLQQQQRNQLEQAFYDSIFTYNPKRSLREQVPEAFESRSQQGLLPMR